jgi:hypothetical protein
MAETRETKDLPVVLTNRELRVRADELAKTVDHVKHIKAEKKANATKFKTQIEEAEGKIGDLATVVKERKELRPVEVVWEANYERSTMELVRLDTGEAIQVRSMTDKERQRQLFPVEERTEDTSPATAETPADGPDAAEASAQEPQQPADPEDDQEAVSAAEDALAAAAGLEDEDEDEPEDDDLDAADADPE